MAERMRRAKQEVNDRATLLGWLDASAVGRLATIDAAGYPLVTPISFVQKDGVIYVHSAPVGEKLDNLRRDTRVGFEIDRQYAITPERERGCQTSAFYESIIVRGRARILDDSDDADRTEKREALRLFVAKYSPKVVDAPLDDVPGTAVVRIDVESLTGKENFGRHWAAELRLQTARALRARDGAAADETIRKMGFSPEKLEDSDAAD